MVIEIIIDTIHAGFRQVKFPVILMNKILWCDITVVLVEYIVQEVHSSVNNFTVVTIKFCTDELYVCQYDA
jgi:hypothetical protein